MRVLRGRDGSVDADGEVTRELVSTASETGEPGLRVWYPPAQVAFGPRDQARDGYQAARNATIDCGSQPSERETGGRPVAFTGDVLAFVRAEPADPTEPGIDRRYEETMVALETTFEGIGVEARRGEPPATWCPGRYSLSADGKLAGLAQRIRREVAIVAGAVVVRDADAVADVLGPVYDALGLPFAPDSVGSLEAAGGSADRVGVRRAVEDAFVGDSEPTVVFR